MTAMAHEPPTQEEVLLEGFLALDTPEGFRAELIEGEIVVTPPPGGHHEKCVSRIIRQVIKLSQAEMDISGNRGLRLKPAEGLPSDRLIPDITFAPLEPDVFGDDNESWMPCEGVAMVVEVTSTRPQADREAKRRCYARGRIPLYLLVDRESAQITLFSDPENGDYREHCARPFGKPLTLPAPFGFDLDTSDFL
ncbi:Uma2 family endonuclease [Streptomyces broussonetiae]|uniref:Uma2 family endonuclease n=1 Tax=Streptomyces broussonetiae TaxID=2686304 RepID=A0ABV5E2V2_9ACTN